MIKKHQGEVDYSTKNIQRTTSGPNGAKSGTNGKRRSSPTRFGPRMRGPERDAISAIARTGCVATLAARAGRRGEGQWGGAKSAATSRVGNPTQLAFRGVGGIQLGVLLDGSRGS